MVKPTEVPEWASDGGSVIVEPTSQKTAGWATGPAVAEYDNWFKNLVAQWLGWLSGLENETLERNGPAGDASPIFTSPTTPTVRKLVWRFKNASGWWTRVYFELFNIAGGQDGGLTITHNAAWNGTNWIPDDATKQFSGVRMGSAIVRGVWQPGASSITDAALFGTLSVAPTQGFILPLTTGAYSRGSLLGNSTTSPSLLGLCGPFAGQFCQALPSVFTLLNSWAGHATFPPSGILDAFGYANLEGLFLASPVASNNVACVLPSNLWPPRQVAFVTAQDPYETVPTIVAIGETGAMSLWRNGTSAAGHQVSLSGIRYRVA